jgi:hypothetical protein
VADRVPLDFDPPVRELRALLLGVDDDELTGPTPCPDWTVAALLDHLMGLSSAQHLPPYWRSRLPVLLEDLATAWKEPSAWTGTAQAGGVTMPATALGTVAMNELIMHSWDLARATGQEYAVDPRILETLIEFLSQGPAEGTPGLFGPVVPTESEPALLDQALALAGRRADWRPPRRRQPPRSAPAA